MSSNSGCALKTLTEKGVTENIEHIRVTDLVFVKGKSPAKLESVERVVKGIKKRCL